MVATVIKMATFFGAIVTFTVIQRLVASRHVPRAGLGVELDDLLRPLLQTTLLLMSEKPLFLEASPPPVSRFRTLKFHLSFERDVLSPFLSSRAAGRARGNPNSRRVEQNFPWHRSFTKAGDASCLLPNVGLQDRKTWPGKRGGHTWQGEGLISLPPRQPFERAQPGTGCPQRELGSP